MGCLQKDQPFDQERNEENVHEAPNRDKKAEYLDLCDVEKSSLEFIELANEIRRKAVESHDVELVKKIDKDIKFLLSLRKEENEK
ncbi:hypothetical protein [Thalassobacillus sp. C254]|uniref:hypothetical protein n=1 Tax=Thalassobacillus sp. C254 TaxID=1225341 RepID=UPI0006D1712E|nr:hypothetical protein [Thalassobacillus sp. C254]